MGQTLWRESAFFIFLPCCFLATKTLRHEEKIEYYSKIYQIYCDSRFSLIILPQIILLICNLCVFVPLWRNPLILIAEPHGYVNFCQKMELVCQKSGIYLPFFGKMNVPFIQLVGIKGDILKMNLASNLQKKSQG
jgi:hypothetical protein